LQRSLIGAHVIEAACRRNPMTRQAVGEDGIVTEPAIRSGIRDAPQTLQREVVLRAVS